MWPVIVFLGIRQATADLGNGITAWQRIEICEASYTPVATVTVRAVSCKTMPYSDALAACTRRQIAGGVRHMSRHLSLPPRSSYGEKNKFLYIF